jgi:hypothetical protein
MNPWGSEALRAVVDYQLLGYQKMQENLNSHPLCGSATLREIMNSKPRAETQRGSARREYPTAISPSLNSQEPNHLGHSAWVRMITCPHLMLPLFMLKEETLFFIDSAT